MSTRLAGVAVLLALAAVACGSSGGGQPGADAAAARSLDCQAVGCAAPPPCGQACTAICGCCPSTCSDAGGQSVEGEGGPTAPDAAADGLDASGGLDAASRLDASQAADGPDPTGGVDAAWSSDASQAADVSIADASPADAASFGDAGGIPCKSPAHCDIYASACGCQCLPLAHGASPPPCANPVACFAPPCMGKVAVCDNGYCAVASSGQQN
jgi:hypothetical protein